MFVTKHAINKAKQRFRLGKNYKQTQSLIKMAIRNGNIIERMNKFDYVVEYEGMHIIIEGDIVKTVLTKDQYEYNKKEKLPIIGEAVLRKWDSELG